MHFLTTLARRISTLGYPLGVQFNPEGSLWRDPPMYWEHIVYPAYIEAHQDMFENGDVENGKPTGQRVPGLVVIEPVKRWAEMSIDDIVRCCCDVLEDFCARLDC
ncbi:hypothetical protein JVT61DRAFT_14096 [Boletus reticuloceps]|uniref:Uncharacterized protein n=1 Tax=Boletus reticuloceps TaxID=495285 RepID=A0A8I2YU25_9AGAM|nr:hypothetical protein JVT61DRAFT_14096 [Boletus reticuloceps]